jgi:hypothetical protein
LQLQVLSLGHFGKNGMNLLVVFDEVHEAVWFDATPVLTGIN